MHENPPAAYTNKQTNKRPDIMAAILTDDVKCIMTTTALGTVND